MLLIRPNIIGKKNWVKQQRGRECYLRNKEGKEIRGGGEKREVHQYFPFLSVGYFEEKRRKRKKSEIKLDSEELD